MRRRLSNFPKKSGTPFGMPLFKLRLVRSSELNERYFHCVRAFFALGNFKLHFVVFTNLVYEVRYVNEHVLAGAVYFDEAEAFGFVKEFYGSCLHNAREKMGW